MMEDLYFNRETFYIENRKCITATPTILKLKHASKQADNVLTGKLLWHNVQIETKTKCGHFYCFRK